MKKTSIIVKSLIIVVGLAIILIAFLCWGPKDEASSTEKYIWINIPILYMLFVASLFCMRINLGNVDRRIYAILFLYRGGLVFSALTIGLLFLTGYKVVAVSVAVVLQLVFVLIWLLYILVATVVSRKIKRVSDDQTDLAGNISSLRSLLNSLNVRASNLSEKYNVVKGSISDIEEDIRYLSPCKNPHAKELEHEIVNEVLKLMALVKANAEATEMEPICMELKLLIKERKRILN